MPLVSTHYQVHHSWEAVTWASGYSMPLWLPRLAALPGCTQLMCQTVLHYVSAMPEIHAALIVAWPGWWLANDVDELCKWLKRLSVLCKGLQNLVYLGDHRLNLAPLFELEVLRNRTDLHVDVLQELRNRVTEPRTVVDHQGDLKSAIHEVMSTVAKKCQAAAAQQGSDGVL